MKDHQKKYDPEDYLDTPCDLDLSDMYDPDVEDGECEIDDEEEYQVDDYFRFVENLSKHDLLVLLKWEIQNRLSMSDALEALEERVNSLENKHGES
jgi:hypothetical protein